jgi:hypothetical protein
VFLLGVIVLAGVAVAIRALADTDTVVESLRDLGLPTTGDEWADVGTVAGLTSLAAALLGGLLGGLLGERWHAKLLSRAIDPDVGAEADARRTAELAAAEARVRNTEAQERVDTTSLRGLRDAPDAPDADRRPVTDRPAGSATGSGWYRDPGLDDVPGREDPGRDRDPGRTLGTDADESNASEVRARRSARRKATGGNGTERSDWYRDPDLNDVPARDPGVDREPGSIRTERADGDDSAAPRSRRTRKSNPDR